MSERRLDNLTIRVEALERAAPLRASPPTAPVAAPAGLAAEDDGSADHKLCCDPDPAPATTGEPAAVEWKRDECRPSDDVSLAAVGATEDFTLIRVWRFSVAAARAEAERIYRAAFAPGPRLSQAEREALLRAWQRIDLKDRATLAPLLTETT